MTPSLHTFHAVAFVENLALKELASSFPEARRTPHELWYATPGGSVLPRGYEMTTRSDAVGGGRRISPPRGGRRERRSSLYRSPTAVLVSTAGPD
jgi:hypothetical protein